MQEPKGEKIGFFNLVMVEPDYSSDFRRITHIGFYDFQSLLLTKHQLVHLNIPSLLLLRRLICMVNFCFASDVVKR